MLPSAVPLSFAAGTTQEFRREFSAYPASAGWAYALYLSAGSGVKADGVADGSGFIVTLGASATSGIAGGRYNYVERVTLDEKVVQVGCGQVNLSYDASAPSATDGRTHAERTLAILEAELERRVVGGAVASYTIGGRALSRESLATIKDLINTYRLRVAVERRGRAGGSLGQVLIHFPSVK